MSRIGEEIRKLRAEIPENVSLVAVSKFHPAASVMEAYEAGQRCFGESRVQELLEKIPLLPDDIRWHFIGHLQTNKVKGIIGKTALIESVDSVRLLDLIDRESLKAGIVTNLLLQIHVAREETKFGFYPDELLEYFHSGKFHDLKAVHICGIMGMASNTDDEQRVREDFKKIYSVFRTLHDDSSLGLRNFDIVSMGMSGDWKIAVEEGSDMIRIGTRIFGERQY